MHLGATAAVISDDEAGLLLWHPLGSEFAPLIDADGRTLHEVTLDRMREPRLTVRAWQGNDVLILMPENAAHSVWWFFREGTFTGWYVNLEAPYVRRPDGVETRDLVLDIVVTPERRWEWKDADEFDRLVGHPLYLDKAEADATLAEGQRLIKLIEAGSFPFDGTYADFRPDADWPALRLPADIDSQLNGRA